MYLTKCCIQKIKFNNLSKHLSKHLFKHLSYHQLEEEYYNDDLYEDKIVYNKKNKNLTKTSEPHYLSYYEDKKEFQKNIESYSNSCSICQLCKGLGWITNNNPLLNNNNIESLDLQFSYTLCYKCIGKGIK